MRVVIDTNIIISAFLTKNGRCRQFMNDVFADKYEVVLTQTILEEYERKLNHPKFAFKESTIRFILDWFDEHAIKIEMDESQKVPEMDDRDVSDTKKGVVQYANFYGTLYIRYFLSCFSLLVVSRHSSGNCSDHGKYSSKISG